jgi:CTP-dependent riboflavin kinase
MTSNQLIEYLRKIKESKPDNDDYYTTKELHAMLGVSIDKIREWLQDANEAGLLERVIAKKKNIAGFDCSIPKYRLKNATDTTKNTE